MMTGGCWMKEFERDAAYLAKTSELQHFFFISPVRVSFMKH